MSNSEIHDIRHQVKLSILDFIRLADSLLVSVGIALMVTRGSDDNIIDGLNSINMEQLTAEEAIELNRADIETVQRNQQRIYHLQRRSHENLRQALYRGVGVLVTMMVALMGMMGTFLIVVY